MKPRPAPGRVCGYSAHRGGAFCALTPTMHFLVLGPEGGFTRMACSIHADVARRGATDEHTVSDECTAADVRWHRRNHREAGSFCTSASSDKPIRDAIDGAPA